MEIILYFWISCEIKISRLILDLTKSNFNMLVQGQGISSEIDFTIPLNKELAPVILSENFDFTPDKFN